MQFKARALAVGIAFFTSHLSAQGNVVSPTDSKTMIAAFGKLAEFFAHLNDVSKSQVQSTRLANEESLRAYFCLERVSVATQNLMLFVNAGPYVISLASNMLHPTDEEAALGYAKHVLTQISDEIATTQKQTNDIFGGDCGRRPVVYDHAKRLRAIADEMKPFISELLKRVQATK